MADGLKFNVSFDIRDIQRRFEEVGSREYKRAVQYALDETAKSAKAEFLERLPGALGARRNAGRPNRMSLNPVEYERNRDYDSYGGGSAGRDPSASIKIKPLQSKWMKYLFGDGAQIRTPGDVGLASDRLLVPNASNLYYLLGIKSPGFGRTFNGLDPGAMAKIKSTIEAADAKKSGSGHKAAMRKLGAEARARGRAARGLSTSGFVAKKPDYARVYRGPERVSGLPTYYVAPGRSRDPVASYSAAGRRRGDHAGKHLAWRRPDGTEVWMPDTADSLRGRKPYAASKVGPARLFEAVERASYRPTLELPWQESATDAYSRFGGYLDIEFAKRLDRRAQGRRY